MNKACRSTRAQLAQAEAHQDAVVADLAESGHDGIAARLRRCQRDRQHRQEGQYPWRCRSPGCWACRRSLVRRWWEAFDSWITGPGPAASLAIIPLPDSLVSAVKKLRKGLRDVRDRAARQDHRWKAMAMAGLADGDRALMLVQHPGIKRASLWSVLELRWPDVVLADPGRIEPTSAMPVGTAAALARRRRGIEPIRVVVPPQVMAAVSQEDWNEPLPVCFSD